jgi:electron transfer flavoprotein alpha subunit
MTHKGILVYAEQKDLKIHKVTYELLGLARRLADGLGVELSAVITGPSGIDTDALIQRGADTVYYIEDDSAFSQPDELVYARNLTDLASRMKPEIFLIGATSLGRAIAPRIAAALETGLTADCTGLSIDTDGKLVQIRPAFSENILAHILSDTLPQMATVRYREFEEAVPDPARTGQVIRSASTGLRNEAMVFIEDLGAQEVEISEAEVIVSAGQGIRSPEDFGMLQELAGLLNGMVGASRPMVEQGFISKMHQVGYSGNRVKPRVYIACGISGAPQHLAGMRDSETIIAINSDPSAPIFSIADFSIVGDVYEVIPQLIERIRKRQA